MLELSPVVRRRVILSAGLALPALGVTAGLSGCGGQFPADLNAPETPWPVAADYPQPFRTVGNRILDSRGQDRILRGVAVPEVLWLAERGSDQVGYFNRALFRAAAEWRADIIRVSIMPAVWRHHGDAALFRALDASVAYARRYGLYLILCFHSIGFPPDGTYVRLNDWFYGDLLRSNGAEIYRFWQRVAQRYAREPAVAFYELLNEPARILPNGEFAMDDRPEHWLRWREWCEALVDGIRPHDAHKPIIVGGLQFGYNLTWAPEAPLRRPNIVYATHPYAGADWRFSWEQAFLGPARRLPVLATEFGWDPVRHPESDHKGPQPYREAIFRAFDQAGIGWCAWSFSHDFPPSLLAAPRGYAPSPYGQVVQAALRRRARPLPGFAGS
jgi:hypothetical protein